MTTPDQVLDHLSRTTEQIFGRDDLHDRLSSGKPLRVKFGVDCTAPDLHLGHAVNLWMMRYLQDLGHVVVFLLGDTTTRVGDPTGRSSTRPVLTAEQIERNAQAFLDQVSLVLRNEPDVLEIRRNSEWFDAMPITDLLGELSLVTHSQLMGRDMFQKRVEERREIAMHELIYPLLQGFDSVALQSDLTIVGSDQLFNENMGRELQAKHGQRPQTVITSTITPGLDGGPKQSKSLGNYVGLAQAADDKFGRLMTLNDDLIGVWAKVYTELPIAAVDELARRAGLGGIDARDAKLDLAEAIVARHHGASQAARVRRDFLEVFSERAVPDGMPRLEVPSHATVLQLVTAARPELTRSEARRLIADGGVRVNGVKRLDGDDAASPGEQDVLQAGRRRWFRIHVHDGGSAHRPDAAGR
ncbi:tyrosine--tRNA ligase [Microbacterium sp. TPD7012]|uniref:tyrosine--tRNA ligase n=1 Tax=Microbacterium sp. TPD7012 TaxID=2171975 RepID=UPI000D51ADC5|nr:tyrosine--tRNA ligase [Microbacterium sp. TPD7012]PVE90991.1 tyrosine--tRNA ligase [Microbacterium sp. TPD7012]